MEVKPFSASYPMCATWMKEPEAGPEIMDLSILPPFAGFFFFWEEDDLARFWSFCFVTFFTNVFASLSSAKTNPIMHLSPANE